MAGEQLALLMLRRLKALTVSAWDFTDSETHLLTHQGVAGELIRKDILGDQEGVVTHVDVNLIDVSTCKPIPHTYVELWGSNSIGVYFGVQSRSNGDGGSYLNSNALRGVQPTGPNGTASFITIVPGHYYGRVTHLHSTGYLHLFLYSYANDFSYRSSRC